MTVKVYRFAPYHPDNDASLSDSYATMAFIILNKLTAQPDSEMEVDPVHVDPEGRYLGLNHVDPT